MLASLIAVSVLRVPLPEPKLTYTNFSGLTLNLGEVPLITGSGFQYYEKGWTKGYYSSAWKPVDISRLGDGRLQVRFNGADGQVAGTNTYTETADGFEVDFQFRWRGDKPVRLEATFARLWAPFFAKGRLTIDDNDVGPLDRPPRKQALFEERVFTAPAYKAVFQAPSANVTVTCDKPFQIMDGRNYNIEWAADKELFWIGVSDQDIAPQQTLQYKFRVSISSRVPLATEPLTLTAPVEPLVNAENPEPMQLPLVPQPQSVVLKETTLEVGSNWIFTGNKDLVSLQSEFEHMVWQWWDKATVRTLDSNVRLEISPTGLKPEGYRLEISDKGITISGADRAGVRNGLRTLALLLRAERSRLTLPLGTITDYPRTAWRGVHQFVGPQALSFQSNLMERVLGPLKFNATVLQCERTDWETTKGNETALTMPKKDLVQLVARYREIGIEPIPLVQSLGHAEWIFANKQNLDLAVNPNQPYTLDPRKARTRQLLTDLWTEVAQAIKPKIVHFGLDEIDTRGLPDDPTFADRLWAQQAPFLQSLANKLGVKSMVWGDMMLHPSEAPDAANAPSTQSASTRRRALNQGTYIADWHYKDSSDPNVFISLNLWKKAAMNPIAATWFRPNNIRGFTLAAIDAGAGTLQTTWAGYESNEANMIKAFPQFSAYVLSADYAWSGRRELPEDLPYDPGEVLRRLYFSPPQKVKPTDGFGVGANPSFSIGPYRFKSLSPIQLRGVTSAEAFRAPDSVTIAINKEVSEIILAVDTLARVPETEDVGQATLKFSDGTQTLVPIQYGVHVRSETDSRPAIISPKERGKCAVLITVPTRKTLQSVTVARKGMSAGIRLYGLTGL